MCAATFACVGERCRGTECTPATAFERCGPYACVNGACAADCGLGPCAEGYYCRGDTLACTPRCTSRDDPRCQGYLCDVAVGECEAYCFDDELGCAAGATCDGQGHCLPSSPAR